MKRKNIVLLLTLVWILVAVFSVGYNMLNTYSEIKNWYFLSDGEKRQKIFGDLYDFLLFVQKNTEKTNSLLIFSRDVKTHYFSKYTLYPQKITDTDDTKKLKELADKGTFLYIAIFNESAQLPLYVPVASFSSQTSRSFGTVYKRK